MEVSARATLKLLEVAPLTPSRPASGWKRAITSHTVLATVGGMTMSIIHTVAVPATDGGERRYNVTNGTQSVGSRRGSPA